ncbi:MAG: thrombospondin type 3 repeat-containing protein, partial [Candidatus Peregrinibacteria bacterium]
GESAWDTHEAHGDRRGACQADDDGDGVANVADFCPGTYMPESVPLEFMLFNRYALTGTTGIFREGPRKKIGSFTLEDTRGCSCEQLVDVAEGVRDYYFAQTPLLLRELQSLFPFYTNGARQYGCGTAILRMTRP